MTHASGDHGAIRRPTRAQGPAEPNPPWDELAATWAARFARELSLPATEELRVARTEVLNPKDRRDGVQTVLLVFDRYHAGTRIEHGALKLQSDPEGRLVHRPRVDPYSPPASVESEITADEAAAAAKDRLGSADGVDVELLTVELVLASDGVPAPVCDVCWL